MGPLIPAPNKIIKLMGVLDSQYSDGLAYETARRPAATG